MIDGYLALEPWFYARKTCLGTFVCGGDCLAHGLYSLKLHAFKFEEKPLCRKAKEIEEKSSTDGEGGSVGNDETVVTIDGKTYSNANSIIISSKAAVYVIDGKKCDKEALTKIKPESIASMTVYKAGCKEAVELSGRKDVAVIKVVTK